MEKLLEDLKKRMLGAVEVLNQELGGLRTGRASVALLEPIMVDAYGSRMPMTQVGTITTPEARLLAVQVWDQGLTKAVEKAIGESDLGLSPAVDGQTVRVRLPDLSEERRQELVKVAGKYAENARVSIRNVRRDGIEHIKKQEKDGELSEDERHRLCDRVQELTDQKIKEIDQVLTQKEKDILSV